MFLYFSLDKSGTIVDNTIMLVMPIGQFNSDIKSNKTFRPGPSREFRLASERMYGWAVFLFSEVKNGNFTHDNSDSRAVVHVRNGRRCVRRALLAAVQPVRQKASVPVMFRS